MNNMIEGIPIKMTGGIQAPHSYSDQVTNRSRATIRGLSNARDILEASKAAYGDFEHLQTLKDKNGLKHTALQNVQKGLRGKAFKI